MVDKAEVSTHFRIPIDIGHSTFTVRVPRHHLNGNRKFFFSQLNLIPDYFSQEATKQELDADPDKDNFMEVDLSVKIKFENQKTTFAPDGYANTSSKSKLTDAMAAINEFYEQHKPSFANTSPCFFDWVDIMVGQTQAIEDYVPAMAPIYYNKNFDALEHLDFLPQSVRNVPGANNFKPPIGTFASPTAFADRIRLRFWMAPYTRVVFSSKDPMASDFGFLESQLGEFNLQYKQYILVNTNSYYTPVMIAKLAPNVKLGRPAFKMGIVPHVPYLQGWLYKFQIKKKDYYDNIKLFEALQEYFKQTSQATNTVFSISYDVPKKQFVFNFPESDKVAVSIKCEPDFANRLGFGYVATITKGMQSLPQDDPGNIFDAKKKALTVVYDTGPILCTLDQMSSNTTSGALDQNMAALYPHESGILSMPQSVCSCSSNLTTIHPLTQASAAYVPVTFRLLRIYEDQSISDFAWKCKAYIYGVLQGTCKKV